MAQQTVSSNGVTATLWAVVEEIDDDDEDILEVTIDVVNESSRDLWDLSGDIRSMDGTHAHPLSKPSSSKLVKSTWPPLSGVDNIAL